MKKQLALALALALASTAAAAEGLSYTHVEAGYSVQQYEVNSLTPGLSVQDPKADGGYIEGSVAFGEAPFYAFGGYRKGEDDSVGVRFNNVDLGDIDVDADQFKIGVGYHHTLSDRVDWVGELSYIRTELDSNVLSDEIDGDDFRGSVGLRGNLAKNFEGWAKLNYTDGDMYDSEFSGTLGALVKFNQTWGIVGEAEFGEHAKQYSIGIRASF